MSFMERADAWATSRSRRLATGGPETARGRVAHRAGLAAELAAERLYVAEGGRVVARRWRGGAGEIDLAVELGPTIVFVEVKARRDMQAASEALRPAQARRLLAAAESFLATRPPGQEARIDVVLVDRAGRAERIENAIGDGL